MTSLSALCTLLALTACRRGSSLSVQAFVAPQYPFAGRVYHLAGQVNVAIAVGPNGRAVTATGSGAAPPLIEAAERNVRQWRFKVPKNGPYPVVSAVVYDFKLTGKPSIVGLTTVEFVPPNHVNVVDQPVSESAPEPIPAEGIVEHTGHEPRLLQLLRHCYSKHCANQVAGPVDQVPLRELIDCYSKHCEGEAGR